MRGFGFSGYRRKWQFAFIVCAIPLSVKNAVEADTLHFPGFGRNISEWVAERDYLPAKSTNVFIGIGKYVEVSGPSPDIKKLFLIDYVFDILGGDGGNAKLRGNSTQGLGPGGQQPISNRVSNCVEIEISGQFRSAQFAVNIVSDILCLGVPAVFPERPEAPIVADVWRNANTLPVRAGVFWKDEGSFAHVERSFGQFSLLDGGRPESTGKGSDDQCCQGGYSPTVAVQNLPLHSTCKPTVARSLGGSFSEALLLSPSACPAMHF
jgi:hypothetical protein